MKTSCEKCLFSIKDIYQNQTGCEFNRIELYIAQQAPIISIGEPSHYEIGGRVCCLCRASDMDWGNGLSKEEQKSKARDEAINIIDIIMSCTNYTSVDDILTTARSVEKQNSKNTVFHISVPKELYPPIAKEMRKHFPAKSKLAWRIKTRYIDSDTGEAIDDVVNGIGSKSVIYYLVVEPGAILQEDLLTKIDKALVDRLQRFTYLHEFDMYSNGKKYQIGPLVHCATHRSCGGNKKAEHDLEYEDGTKETIRCDSIYDKIFQISKDQNTQFLIGDLYNICYPQ